MKVKLEYIGRKNIKDIVKGILPAVFCFLVVVAAIDSGGADLQKLPDRVLAGVETPAPDLNQTPVQQVKVKNNNKAEKSNKKDSKNNKNRQEKTKKIKKANINTSELEDGTFTGTGTGFGGDIKSEVTVKDGKITNIKILSASKETPAYFNKAKAVINTMLDKQTCNVDAVSGATYSSNGIIESVQNALGLAESKIKSVQKPEDSSIEDKKPKESKKTEKSKKSAKSKNTDTSNLKDGVYTGTGTGFGGSINVNVTIKNGKITKIKVLSAEYETASYFGKAKGVIKNMLDKQSTDVDTVSGATYSSNGIIEAVNNALSKAVVDKKQDSGSKGNYIISSIGNLDVSSVNNTNNSESESNETNEITEDSTDDDGEWVLISKTSEEYVYPVTSYCESYNGDFEGYDIKFNIIITTEITEEENAVKSIRTTTNNYVSAVELEKDTIDYATKTGNWAFLNMAANGTGQKIGLFEQLISSNSTSNLDAVFGATCSSDALSYGMKSTLKNIVLGKTVVIN